MPSPSVLPANAAQERTALTAMSPPVDWPAVPPATPVERDAMAWPPAAWEVSPSAWRPEAAFDPSLFQPYGSAVALPADLPVPSAGAGRAVGTVVRELVETVFLALLIFVGIRLVVQNFKIEGSSMEPTLHNGQRLLVNRLAYLGLSEPRRGDIVVFRAWDQDEDYIKRVVGVPGDEIEVVGDRLVVNGNPLDEPYIRNHPTHGGPGRVVLAPGTYYVLGDNRDNSSDSRLHGPLAADHIVGKAWVTYWPIHDLGFVSDFASYAAPRP